MPRNLLIRGPSAARLLFTMKLLTVAISLLFVFSLLSSSNAALTLRAVTRAERVKRDWLSDIMSRGYQNAYEPRMPQWTGWRCHGTNGIFLDCAGR
uniref:SCP domain-containing protein n=1 Tax=Steinernema glaseri TaxID=37863 RepID=A0A1I7Z442_9BILA